MPSCLKCQDAMPDTMFFPCYLEQQGGTVYYCWNCYGAMLSTHKALKK
ncbi:TPA: hypothetical protein HA238_02160 [Candidatus Micrarchaeota archaeon]|nr:hypothetical protein [Candidatus Micrarchaeota archaeon]